MSDTQSNTQSTKGLDGLMTSMEREIASTIARTQPQPERAVERRAPDRAATASPPPGQAGGPPPNFLWGPSSTRITSPQQMLAQVADHAQKLHGEMVALTGAITGEAPPPKRLRQTPIPGGGL